MKPALLLLAVMSAVACEGQRVCEDGAERWLAYDRFGPWCPGTTPAASREASGCELYVDHLGDGMAAGEAGVTRFYKLYAAVSGALTDVEAGLLVSYRDGTAATPRSLLSFGAPLTPVYFVLGVTYESDEASLHRTVESMTLFADVRQRNGTRVRLVAPPVGGFAPAGVVSSSPTRITTDFGWIDYADESSTALFAPKRACAR